MENFVFHNYTKTIFGKGMEDTVGKEIKAYADKVLLHYGGGSIKKSGLYDRVVKSLKAADVEFVELGGVQPNPRLKLVYEGIELCKKENIGFILAVGGGSVIDSSKAIALGVKYSGDVWDFYAGKAQATEALPVATVLTIPAAGSESSPSSVITNDDIKIKSGYTSNITRPVFSILNPEYCFTLPKNQAANGICDMMVHIFERYFTNTENADLTDRLCEATLKSIMYNAPKIMKNMSDYDAWAEIMWASSVAHNDILGVGRKQDWASHAIEHEISAIYDIAHGAGLAIISPAWMKYAYKDNVPMFTQFARNVMGVEGSFKHPDELILTAISRLESFYKSIGLPTRLSDLDIGEENIELMAEKCVGDGCCGGLKKLYKQDVVEIYKLAK
ncbi:MAG: iron-containing alcohol dehydrogenase [Clostridia bacterium]|nr:iron-containing alcohol dehydrogenase [Clostridia bacterium]